MSRRPSSFKQAELKRAVQATRAAGEQIDEVVISPSGHIKLRLRGGNVPRRDQLNDFDRDFG